jgi:sensor c-di-GMP phosphodiesterase-like protein
MPVAAARSAAGATGCGVMLKLAFTPLGQPDPLDEVAVSFGRRKAILAVVFGVALAGVPMAAFNLWLGHFIEQQGQQEVASVAKRSLAMADARVARIVTSLNELKERGVDSCGPSQVDALRRANFSTTPAKELSIVDATGQTLCSDLGVPLGARTIVSSQPLTADGEFLIEVVGLAERNETVIRIRRVGTAGANGLAALVPTELFLPQVSTQGGPLTSRATLSTREGTLVAENGVVVRADDGALFTASAQSERYNLAASVALPRELVMAIHADLNRVGAVLTSIIALVIIGLALVVPARRRGDPVAEIERAMLAGELVPYFQPVVDITTGKLYGAEVLIRWLKPDGSLVLPGAFIPLLESTGLIIDVTRALMRRARDEVGAAYGSRPLLRLSFNLAAAHFADETIVRDVRDLFENSPIRLNQVVLEVTERQPLENLTETRRIIAALQGLGAIVAIDDVGTGHSGLSYMLKLGVDLIKIDKLFVDAIGTDGNSATIIETLIDLAHNMRMDIIAEGVESFEQVEFLRGLGIRAAQGYVFAPPLPASSFLQLIEAIDPLPQPLAQVPAGASASAPATARSAA